MSIEISEIGFWPFDDDSAEAKMKKKIEEQGMLPIQAPPPEERKEGWQYKAEEEAVKQYKAEGKPLPAKYAEQVKAGEAKAVKGKAIKKKVKALSYKPSAVPQPEKIPVVPQAAIGMSPKTIGIVTGGIAVIGLGLYLAFAKKKG